VIFGGQCGFSRGISAMRILLLFSVLVLLIGVLYLPVRGQVQITDEEYRIYSIAFKGINFIQPDKLILIGERTSDLDLATHFFEDESPRSEPLFEDFGDVYESLDKEPANLSARFEMGSLYRLVYDDEIKSLLEPWQSHTRGKSSEILSAHFPDFGGLVNFSRIAFNSSKRTALVYVSIYGSDQCSQAQYVVLKKKGKTWVIKDKVPIFQSPNFAKRSTCP
jgi:hypothetical protein